MKLTSIIAALMTTIAFADETHVFLNEHHRLYFEPDAAYGIPSKMHDEDLTIKESGFLLGINAGYEFLKSNSFYAGAETNLSVSNRFANLYLQDQKVAEGEIKGFQNKICGTFGYTLTGSNLWFTPFSGAGGYFLSEKPDRLYIAYIPVGIRAEYRMAKLSIGLNAQQMHYVRVWQRSKNEKLSVNVFGDGNYGYEISLPLSFKMDTAERHWHATVEPYYLKLTTTTSYVGGRIAGLYNF